MFERTYYFDMDNLKFLDEIVSNFLHQIFAYISKSAISAKKRYYSRFSFWYEIRVLEKNVLWPNIF